MRTLNFLLVDDSTTIIRNLSYMLEQLGHKVVGTAHSGVSAIAEYERCMPDIVTMDISMPGMNGIEATEQILQKHPDAVIIMVTAIGLEHLVMEALTKGAKTYLFKPINFASFSEIIEKVSTRYLCRICS